MALDVVFKTDKASQIPIEIFRGENLSFERLDESMIFINSKMIARGIRVKISDKELVISLNTPTSENEVDEFMKMNSRTAEFLHISSLAAGGREMTIDDLLACRDEIMEHNRKMLVYSCQTINDSGSSTVLECAYMDLSLGKNESELFMPGDDNVKMDLFASFMHDRQRIDADFAEPKYYRSDDSEDDDALFFGAYLFPENTNVIFPTSDMAARSALGVYANRVSYYNVALFSQTEDRIIGEVRLDDFLDRLPEGKVSYFDADHILVSGLSNEMLHAVCNG